MRVTRYDAPTPFDPSISLPIVQLEATTPDEHADALSPREKMLQRQRAQAPGVKATATTATARTDVKTLPSVGGVEAAKAQMHARNAAMSPTKATTGSGK